MKAGRSFGFTGLLELEKVLKGALLRQIQVYQIRQSLFNLKQEGSRSLLLRSPTRLVAQLLLQNGPTTRCPENHPISLPVVARLPLLLSCLQQGCQSQVSLDAVPVLALKSSSQQEKWPQLLKSQGAQLQIYQISFQQIQEVFQVGTDDCSSRMSKIREEKVKVKEEGQSASIQKHRAKKLSVIENVGKESNRSERRVAANSSVNFAHLTDEEQVLRYKNMLKEYNELKQLVRKQAKEVQEQLAPVMPRPERTRQEKAIVAAQKKIKQGVYEIQDSNELMENLASLLAKKKMKGDSLEFGLIAALVRKVMNKLKKGDQNLVGRTQRRYLKVASKEGLIEYFTGIRLDHDEELKSSVRGHEKRMTNTVGQGRKARQSSVPQSSEVDKFSIQSSYRLPPPVQPPANSGMKLNAAMLRQFNLDHPHFQNWG